jgi:hypothetical protein
MAERRIWLCVPPVTLGVIDHAVTLAGQPRAYWGGGFHEARELAPHGYWLLSQHPIVFLSVGAVWLAACVTLVYLLPRRAALAASLAVVIGHAWGIGTWLPLLCYPNGYWLCLGFFLLTSALVVFAWERAHSFLPSPRAAASDPAPERRSDSWATQARTHF